MPSPLSQHLVSKDNHLTKQISKLEYAHGNVLQGITKERWVVKLRWRKFKRFSPRSSSTSSSLLLVLRTFFKVPLKYTGP